MLQRLLVVLALLAAPLAQAESYVSGQDYFPIQPPHPPADAGKIEVVEVFGYSCIHCAHAAPLITDWRAGLGEDVRFEFLPAVFGGVWEAFGRAYYTAETMGVLDKSHDRIFQIVHEERRPIRNLDDIAAIYTEFGADKEAFLGTMQSFPVNAKIAQAAERGQKYQVEGTPSMIVNGKYRVVAPSGDGSYQKMLDIVDHLIAQERAALKAG